MDKVRMPVPMIATLGLIAGATSISTAEAAYHEEAGD